MNAEQIAARLEILSAKLERQMFEQELNRRPLEDEIKELMIQQAEIAARNNELELIQE